MPYLVTGHTIYFHRLIMGDPNCEIDHIDRNTHNNCKKIYDLPLDKNSYIIL